jgi:hypothetical protein
MSERQIVLAEALDDTERSREIRSRVSADGKRFHAFLIGKDGHVALSSDKPLPADYLFQRIDAMPMRQDEMAGPLVVCRDFWCTLTYPA